MVLDSPQNDEDNFKRTGTLVTASAHIITGVIGSGVLSLTWSISQLGWVAGPVALACFAFITWYCSTLLADCYRTNGDRNQTYMDAVRANLGGAKVLLCGLAQYVNLVGVTIAYIITTAVSLVAIKRSNCIHKSAAVRSDGEALDCQGSPVTYMFIFAGFQVVLSQLQNFHKIWGLSIVAAAMSFAYSSIGLALSIAKIAEDGVGRTTLTGVTIGVDVTASEKVWRAFTSFGNIASAFTYSMVLIEIQDTLKSNPPENEVMKKASLLGVSVTTVFYMLCGICGYAAFGNDAPGNLLAGFFKPYWLIDLANVAIAIHLIGAYQVFSQPVFQFVEKWSQNRWPDNPFLSTEHGLKLPLLGYSFSLNLFRMTWRSLYVVGTTVIAMVFPFFNGFLGLVGGLAFWPLTVYFPVEMYISQAQVRRFSATWLWLQILSAICFLVSLLAACGSLQGLVHDIRHYHPFKNI